jgi:hypothetical protein
MHATPEFTAMTWRSRKTDVLKLVASSLALATLSTIVSLVFMSDVRRLGQEVRPSRWEAFRILFDYDVLVSFALPQFVFLACVSLLSMSVATLMLRRSHPQHHR